VPRPGPPDVIVSPADNYYSGSRGLDGFVKVAGTHGGLSRADSTTFIMSTAGPLPPLMRSREIPANMTGLTGLDWPRRRQAPARRPVRKSTFRRRIWPNGDLRTVTGLW